MSDSHSTAQCTQVRKRDGQSEPFSRAKIAACLRHVLLTSGEGTEASADELAKAVSQFLISSRPSGVLRAHEIAALLPRVLEQTGHAESASVLRGHARQRERLRRHVRVLAWKPSVSKIVPRRWNKSVLVARLRQENTLEPAVARIIAGQIEAVVLSLGLRVVTGGLVRELAACNLMAWGLAQGALEVKRPRASGEHRSRA